LLLDSIKNIKSGSGSLWHHGKQQGKNREQGAVENLKKKIRFQHILVLVLLLLFIFFLIPVRRVALYPQTLTSLQILDRNGVLLRQVLSQDEAISHWVSLSKISPYLIKATLASEDKRFYNHWGVDFLALLRALKQNLAAGAIVSGGSTITQQLAKNLYHLKSRTLLNKAWEALLALRLELWLTKMEILELYFNRVSYGNLTTGIEAASQQYFSKPSLYLSLAEAAFLAAIPRAPSYYDPYSNLNAVKHRQVEIIQKMQNLNFITAKEAEAALQEKLKLKPARLAFRAPHWCNYILSVLKTHQLNHISKVKTTLDLYLQQEVERLLRQHIDRLKDYEVTNAAALVMKNDTNEILALVGSYNFWNKDRQGQVDGVLALRQPGSAVKPFTYALALESGMTPSELIADLETHFPTAQGNFSPLNYDEKYHGPVRLRNALACSYNVCAVAVLHRLGVEKLLKTLKELGLQHLNQSATYYGLALTLGCAEASLLEMVRAYKTLANNGYFSPEKVILQAWIKRKKS
jgi:penicillin-binding protein 1C